MKKDIQDYVPCGPEWEIELMKLSKKILIAFLKKNILESQELKKIAVAIPVNKEAMEPDDEERLCWGAVASGIRRNDIEFLMKHYKITKRPDKEAKERKAVHLEVVYTYDTALFIVEVYGHNKRDALGWFVKCYEFDSIESFKEVT